MLVRLRPDVARDQAEELFGHGREFPDLQIRPDHDDRDVGVAEKDLQEIVAQVIQLGVAARELVIDRRQLLIGRLELLFGGLKLLVGALELFVGRHDLLVRALHLLVGRVLVLDDRLQRLLRGFELVSQQGVLANQGVELPVSGFFLFPAPSSRASSSGRVPPSANKMRK